MNAHDQNIGTEKLDLLDAIPTLISASDPIRNRSYNDIDSDGDVVSNPNEDHSGDSSVENGSSLRDLKEAFKDLLDPPTISVSSPSTSSFSSSSSSPVSSPPEMRGKPDDALSNGCYLNEEEDEEDDRSASTSWDEDDLAGQFQNHRDSLRLGTPRPSRESYDSQLGEVAEERDTPDAGVECEVERTDNEISQDKSRVEAEFEKRTATLNIFDEIDLNQK